MEGYDNRELLNIGFDTDNKKFILSRFNRASYFHGAFNDFFKINIKTKDGKEKLSLTIKGTDFPTSDKVNVLENFNFEYGDTLTLWHASTNDIDGKIKITGNVLDNKENYSDRLSLDAMNNTLFQLTHNGLKALYNESPIISGIEDVTLKVGESFDPLEGVSVSDDFDNNLIPTITGTVTPNVAGTYTLTYAIKDSGGREFLSTRNITVETNEKPIFTGIDDIEIKAGTSFNNLLGVKATDKEDGDLSKSIIVKGNVDINTPGIYELNYFVEDKDGNSLNEIRLINVKSNTKPVLEGVDNLTIKVNDIFEPLQGITATDMEDFDLNNSINIVGKVDTSKIGIYDLIYSVKDSDNNEIVKTRRITVRSNEKPVIDGASNEVLKVHDSFNPLKGIIAIDKEDGDLIKNITIKGMVNTSKEGVY
ncbi:MAG: immunoglobulin-like domain-containing protein, partial [Sarcina sp.]